MLRLAIHRGDTASLTEEDRSATLFVGLGLEPGEIYLPNESSWAGRVPSWLRSRRAEVLALVADTPLRVVESDRYEIYTV